MALQSSFGTKKGERPKLPVPAERAYIQFGIPAHLTKGMTLSARPLEYDEIVELRVLDAKPALSPPYKKSFERGYMAPDEKNPHSWGWPFPQYHHLSAKVLGVELSKLYEKNGQRLIVDEARLAVDGPAALQGKEIKVLIPTTEETLPSDIRPLRKSGSQATFFIDTESFDALTNGERDFCVAREIFLVTEVPPEKRK